MRDRTGARSWRTVAHPRARENALKPFGGTGRQDGRIKDACLEMVRPGHANHAGICMIWETSRLLLGATLRASSCGGWRGAAPPLTPGRNPAPAAFAVGGSEGPPQSARRRMFSRRWPITAGRCPSASRLSPRSDRRAAWFALPRLRRRSSRPPARTPSVPPTGVESPPQPGRKEGGADPYPNVPVRGQAGERCFPMASALPPLCRTAV